MCFKFDIFPAILLQPPDDAAMGQVRFKKKISDFLNVL